MKILIISLLGALWTFGCGVAVSEAERKIEKKILRVPPRPATVYDEDFLEVLRQFKADAASYKVSTKGFKYLTSLRYGKIAINKKNGLNPKTIGVCIKKKYNGKLHHMEIIIRPDMKSRMKFFPIYFKTLLYHELGHCVLGKKHATVPNLIMSPAIPPQGFLKAEWDSLLEQFFTSP